MINPLKYSFFSALPNIKHQALINTAWIVESHFESDFNRFLFFLQETCLSVQKFIQGALGHYAANVTTAAKLCSQSLCNNNGRCVRKIPESSSYLHMPESSSKKHVLGKSLRFTISPASKLKMIKDLKDGFVCHCYHGWHGESCQQRSSDVLRGKSKAPLANFKFSVILGMISSGILLILFTPLQQCQFFPWKVENTDFFFVNFNLLLKYLLALKLKKEGIIISSTHW